MPSHSFPLPLQSVVLSLPDRNFNSSVMVQETVYIAPNALRAHIEYSGTPFGGSLPPGFPSPANIDSFNDYAKGFQWIWFEQPDSQVYCNKSPLKPSEQPGVCVGPNLSLNSTRTFGGKPTYSWVGPSTDTDVDKVANCWSGLWVNSVESTDPAAWLFLTQQCVVEGSADAYQQAIHFFDYSTEPFAPNTFKLPAECPK